MRRPTAPERVDFRQGGLLARRDLAASGDYEARLRAAHVRGAHATWGVALGFDVGQPSNRRVTVSPGLAYDCAGRELVMSRPRTVTLPRTRDPSYWDLAIRWDEGGVAFRWARAGFDREAPPAASLRFGEEIPLARLRAGGGGSTPDLRVRQEARSARPKRVAVGQANLSTEAIWSRAAALVSTADAGFESRPLYVARLVVSSTASETALAGLARNVAGPFLSVSEPTATSFKALVQYPRIPTSPLTSAFALVPALFQLQWIGVELESDCPEITKPIAFSSTRGAPIAFVAHGPPAEFPFEPPAP